LISQEKNISWHKAKTFWLYRSILCASTLPSIPFHYLQNGLPAEISHPGHSVAKESVHRLDLPRETHLGIERRHLDSRKKKTTWKGRRCTQLLEICTRMRCCWGAGCTDRVFPSSWITQCKTVLPFVLFLSSALAVWRAKKDVTNSFHSVWSSPVFLFFTFGNHCLFAFGLTAKLSLKA
jgi:hypothetical protein